MKFIIHGGALSRSLQSISSVVPSSRTMPILLNFLLEATNEDLIITASDLETTISVKLTPSILEQGNITKIAIPAKMFLEVVNSLSTQQITINVTEDYSVEITAGTGKYKLVGENPESYPEATELTEPSITNISSSVLVKAIGKTIFATGTGEMRPQMTGVLCEQTPEGTTFVATDAHKLVKYTRTDCKNDEARSCILPKTPLNILNKLLSSHKEEIDVVMANNQTNVRFEFENYTLISRLIDGKYPNYNMAIPENNPNNLIIDRQMLFDSVKRVALFANQVSNQVVFRLKDKELFISAEDSDMSTLAKERLNCNYDGEELEIGFNADYLMEMLNNIDTELLLMEMSTPDRAGIIFPYKEQEEETAENILMLVMPVVLIK